MARKIRAIFWIGLAAGTLDITENLVFNHFRGISPWRVFQYIASGLIGMKSFQSAGTRSRSAWQFITRSRWPGREYFFSPHWSFPRSLGVRFCPAWFMAAWFISSWPLWCCRFPEFRIRRPRSPLRQESTPCWLLFSVLDCPSRFSRAEHLMKQQTHRKRLMMRRII